MLDIISKSSVVNIKRKLLVAYNSCKSIQFLDNIQFNDDRQKYYGM